jgi:hypothetical protein
VGRQLRSRRSGRQPYGRGGCRARRPRHRPQPVPAVTPPVPRPPAVARPSSSRQVRQSPRRMHSDRAGTPRIVRVGPSTVKGTRRSFLTAPQNPLRRKHLWDPPLTPETFAAPAGLTARARPKARPDKRAANLRETSKRCLFIELAYPGCFSASCFLDRAAKARVAPSASCEVRDQYRYSVPPHQDPRVARGATAPPRQPYFRRTIGEASLR